MNHRSVHALKRLLRSPTLIVGELATFAAAGVAGALLPAAGGPTGVAGADRVFGSPAFAGLCALTAASLSVVVFDQLRRLRAVAAAGSPARLLRHAGSPLLHLGLLLVMGAGALRALFASEAVVDLVEGETLAPTPAGWAAQWPGLFARPFAFGRAVTLKAVQVAHYETGPLRDLRARLAVGGAAGEAETDLAVNRSVHRDGRRLFLGADFGPAVLLEWFAGADGTDAVREAVLLRDSGRGSFEGETSGPGGVQAYLRTRLVPDDGRPAAVDVRAMRGAAVLFAGSARAGQTVALPDGTRLVVRDLPLWVRLRGSRDAALGLAYAGFALVLAGVTLVTLRRPHPLPAAATAVLPVLLVLLALASCRRAPSTAEARALVERYNRVVAEAYRRGDPEVLDAIVGPKDGRRIAGLIGVRLDLGLTLDSELLSLDVTGVEEQDGALNVRTAERWRYRDLRIGSGEQAGEASVDDYDMLYVFRKAGRDWQVAEIRFTSAPRVGRTRTPWLAGAHKRAEPAAPTAAPAEGPTP